MTVPLRGFDLAERLGGAAPDCVEEANATDVWVKPEALLEVAHYLKETEGLEFDFLNAVTAVDYVEYFEMVYHLTSLRHNHGAVVKTKLYDRDNPTVASLAGLWKGADFQEREVYDLMGVTFTGHPNLKRIMLWEGFQGHPLVKDYLEAPLPYTWPQGG